MKSTNSTLLPTSAQMIQGIGDLSAPVWIVGDNPDLERGRPFKPQAEKELEGYLARAGHCMRDCYLTNLADDYLTKLSVFTPRVILAVGEGSTRYFLGDDSSLEYTHGILYHVYFEDIKKAIPVMPCHSIDQGMTDSTKMTLIEDAIRLAVRESNRIGVVVRRVWESWESWEPSKTGMNTFRTEMVDSPDRVREILVDYGPGDLIGMDTESWGENNSLPWCVTFAMQDKDIGYFISHEQPDTLQELNRLIKLKKLIPILHNALWDLSVLRSMGISLERYKDTMIMAYLLQKYPLKLKVLAYRLMGIHMRNYVDVIQTAQKQLTAAYLKRLLQNPERLPGSKKSLVFEKGKWREKKEQETEKKLKNFMRKYLEMPGVMTRWKKLTWSNEVEECCGKMPTATLNDVDFNDAVQYACEDAIATIAIYPRLRELIIQSNLYEVEDTDLAIIPMVDDMQKNGVGVDVKGFETLTGELQCCIQAKENEIKKFVNPTEVVNLNSNQQLGKLLCSLGVFDTSKQSVSSEALDVVRKKHPIVKLLTEYKKLEKLNNTYVKTLPTMADNNNRIHTKISTTNVITGRLSTSHPNLQNQPKIGMWAKKIRDCFVAQPGCVFISADYCQIEMRVLAHMSKDPVLLEMMRDPKRDIHSETASWIFGIPVEHVDQEKHRYPAKAVGFGIIYGLTGIGLSKQLLAKGMEIPAEDCDYLIDSWLAMYSGVKKWMAETKRFIRERGYAVDLFGRRRLIPGVRSVHKRIIEGSLRQGINAPIQGGAQGIIKRAMGALTTVYRNYRDEQKKYVNPVIQIHDDLMFEVTEEIMSEFAGIMKLFMENVIKLDVPLPTEQSVGERWGSMKKLENS